MGKVTEFPLFKGNRVVGEYYFISPDWMIQVLVKAAKKSWFHDQSQHFFRASYTQKKNMEPENGPLEK